MADSDGKDKRGRCQKLGDGFSNFAKFLFNKETGQVMGRSGESWLKILAFYLVFYGFLAGFFAAMLTVFLTTLNDPGAGEGKNGPKLIQFLENKPGLTFAVSLNLNYHKGEDKQNITTNYMNAVEAFFKKYDRDGEPVCTANNTNGMLEGKNCKFDTKLLGECGPDAVNTTTFGLAEKKPCIYVKINKVYGWVPKGPEGDKEYLHLICGEEGEAEVIPKGFLIAAFPFRGQKNFELPVVAVKINLDKVQEDKKTTKVDCYLKGKGIELSESYIPHRAYSKIRIS